MNKEQQEMNLNYTQRANREELLFEEKTRKIEVVEDLKIKNIEDFKKKDIVFISLSDNMCANKTKGWLAETTIFITYLNNIDYRYKLKKIAINLKENGFNIAVIVHSNRIIIKAK